MFRLASKQTPGKPPAPKTPPPPPTRSLRCPNSSVSRSPGAHEKSLENLQDEMLRRLRRSHILERKAKLAIFLTVRGLLNRGMILFRGKKPFLK